MSCLPIYCGHEEKWSRQNFVETEFQRSNTNQDSEPKIDMRHWSCGMEYGIFFGVVPLLLLILPPFFQTGIFILATLFFLHCCILDRLEIAKLVYCPQDSKSGISYLTWEKDISSKALGPVSRCNTWWYFEIPTWRSSECICDYMQTHYFI